MKESEGKRKEAGTAKRFPPKNKNINRELITVVGLGAFIANPSYKIPKKKTKSKIYYEGQIWKKQKTVTKKSKMSKSRKSEQCRRYKQWQQERFFPGAVKICRMRNFATCEIM